MARDQMRGDPSGEQFYSHIPQLVRSMLNDKPDKARRSQRELLTAVKNDTYLDGMFIAFGHVQQLLVDERNPQRVRRMAEATMEVSNEVVTHIMNTGSRQLRVTPVTVKTARGIIDRDKRVQENTFLTKTIEEFLANSYENYLSYAVSIVGAHGRGDPSFEVRYFGASVTEEERVQRSVDLHAFNAWISKMRNIALPEEIASHGVLSEEAIKRIDVFVDELRQEPETHALGRERLFERQVAGISLQDISRLPYPPSEKDLKRITEYIATVGINSDIGSDDFLAQQLFLIPIHFASGEGVIEYRNHRLLANINFWQERFVDQFLYTKDPQEEGQIRAALEHFLPAMGFFLLADIFQFASYGIQRDPEFTGENFRDRVDFHPLLVQAIEWQMDQNPHDTMMYSDEVGRRYFELILLPKIEERFAYFGVAEKFQKAFTIFRESALSETFSEYHLGTLRKYFETRCGEDFLTRLNQHSDQIEELTHRVWGSIFQQKGMHFLPMQEGVNIVEFSKDSVPDILGLKEITLKTSGTPQDWQVELGFKLQDTFIGIQAKLGDNGDLVLKTSLKEAIPGLYTMLNHIAVLVFHDLVVQERSEREQGDGEQEDRGNNTKDKEQETGTMYTRSLPRRQTDRELVSDVYAKTGFMPRRVEVHPTTLRGANDYLRAVGEYEIAIAENRNDYEENLKFCTEWLEYYREKAFQASEEKKAKVPARFTLGWIQDPIIGERRDLETWVVEHTSPKPTEEELRSPVKLFERHYKHSSALASLDQMKPWFIGA